MCFNITFIGAGNVAWHLAQIFKDAGHNIVQIYSHHLANAQALAEITNAVAVDNFNNISPETDIFVYSVKDDVLPEVIENNPVSGKIHLHTSGSCGMNLFATTKQNYGCLYPLQTFSKAKEQICDNIPFFIEANSPETEKIIEDLALSVSKTVYRLTSEGRKYLHLAGVFACNFTNVMYIKAAEIVEKQNIPFVVMRNLITEAVNKALLIGPQNSQTGPAARNDVSIMNEHIKMLDNEKDWQKIYTELSDLIKKQQHEF